MNKKDLDVVQNMLNSISKLVNRTADNVAKERLLAARNELININGADADKKYKEEITNG